MHVAEGLGVGDGEGEAVWLGTPRGSAGGLLVLEGSGALVAVCGAGSDVPVPGTVPEGSGTALGVTVNVLAVGLEVAVTLAVGMA